MCKKRSKENENRILDIGMNALELAYKEAKRTGDIEGLLHVAQLADNLINDEHQGRTVGFSVEEGD